MIQRRGRGCGPRGGGLGGGGARSLTAVHLVVKGRWFHHLIGPKCAECGRAAERTVGLGGQPDRTHDYEAKVTRWRQYTTIPAMRQAKKAPISGPEGQFQLLGLFAAAVFQKVVETMKAGSPDSRFDRGSLSQVLF